MGALRFGGIQDDEAPVRPSGQHVTREEVETQPDGEPHAERQAAHHALAVLSSDLPSQADREQALRVSEARFRALADSMPQLVWTANAAGDVDYYNARSMEYDGIEPCGDGRWHWEPVLHPDDVETTLEAWVSANRTGSVYTCEHRLRMADGTYRWHISRAYPVREESGRRWFGTATDIHEQKMSQERLHRALAARDQVVSVVSHDLRNPLSVVRTSIPLLRKVMVAETSEKGRDFGGVCLDRLERQVTKMEKLLGELLDVARLQAGQPLSLHRQACDLVGLLQELTREYGRASSPHTLETRCHLGRLVGEWDPDRIERVFDNLLSNAVKYSPRGSRIVIQVLHTGEHAEVRVSDEGVGISNKDHHRIFEWFARGENAAATARGIGIGLAGARNIVELHGGSLTVESELGVGSTFIVRLPLLASPPVGSHR